MLVATLRHIFYFEGEQSPVPVYDTLCREAVVFHANYTSLQHSASDQINDKELFGAPPTLQPTSPGDFGSIPLANQLGNKKCVPCNQRWPRTEA